MFNEGINHSRNPLHGKQAVLYEQVEDNVVALQKIQKTNI